MDEPQIVKEFRYDLLVPFEYDFNNTANKEAEYLIIKAPSAILRNFTSILSAEYNKAQLVLCDRLNKISGIDPSKNQQTETSNEDDKKDDKKIAMLIGMSDGKLGKCYDALKDILIHKKAKPCLINNEQFLITDLFDKISIPDLDRILGRYIESFL